MVLPACLNGAGLEVQPLPGTCMCMVDGSFVWGAMQQVRTRREV